MSRGNFGVGCRRSISADGGRSGRRHWPTGERPACTLRRVGLCIRAECRRGKAPGEPYEGKLHVRFDEGVLETELWSGLRHRRYGESCRQPKSPFLGPPRQRPTLQKRNVVDHLPDEYKADVRRKIQNAYAMLDYDDAKRALERLHRELLEMNPSAARSLEEGMEETLTVHKLRVPDQLRRTLS